MMFRLATSLFSLLLVFQLVTLQVHISPINLQYGETHERPIKEKRSVTSVFQTAQLATNYTKDEFNSIIFVGDVMLARNLEYLTSKYGAEHPFLGFDLKSLLPNPAIVGNFEAAIPSNHETTPAGQLKFSVPTSSLSGLVEAGFTHVSLGNNHSYDYDAAGYKHTFSVLENEKLIPFGDEYAISDTSISYFKLQNKTAALIGLNLLQSYSDNEIRNVIKTASKRSDFQILFVHWGEEYDLYHSKTQTKMATLMIDAGADMIVGHHPHVVQGIDVIHGVPVFYSLGNYVFDQYFSQDVQEGLVLAFSATDETVIHLLPVSSVQSKSQPRLMDFEDHTKFLETLARKSAPELQNQIKNGSVVLESLVATSSKMAIMKQ